MKIQAFIVGLLFLFWGILTCLYIIRLDWSITNVSSYHFNSISTHQITKKLLQNTSIKGKFIATDNNLGVISIRFETYERPAYEMEDVLVFRLREVGSNTVYYENNYRVGLIYEMPVFPFGFPLIHDSIGKQYEFEVVSLQGNQDNSVSIRMREPVVSTKYVFSKQLIFNTFIDFRDFIFKKFIRSFINIDIIYSSFIYALPLVFFSISSIFYYVIMIPKINVIINSKNSNRYLKKLLIYIFQNKEFPLERKLSYLYICMLFLSLYDILYLQLKNDGVYFIFLFLHILLTKKGLFRAQNYLYTAVIYIIASAILGIWDMFPVTEQFSIYALLYFTAFLFHQIRKALYE